MIDEINLTSTSSLSSCNLAKGELALRSWGNIPDCKGIVILVHGLGAHGAWFEAMARQLKVRRWHAIAYDQKGFGLRQNEKVESYKDWIDELCQLFNQVKSANPNKPVYLLGNSMGALVVLAACALIKPDGIIIASPGLDGHPETFTLGYKLTSLFKAVISPSSEVALPYSSEKSTRTEEVKKWLEQDSYQRKAVPGQMLFELLKLSFAIRGIVEVRVPVLMVTAGHERVVNNELNFRFFQELRAPFKASKHFGEAWHDLMFDPAVDEVADAIVDWQSELMLETVLSN
ncbi:MAG: lysophospholipase [Candidatus Obscuribacterales bacterium]|nr:lysophospholipase [Candidatus Obscuribacterales bacterium]